MALDDLIGKKFKYISPYSKKESDWTGVVKDYLTVRSCFGSDFRKYKMEIHIVSETGSSYKLDELIFLN